MSDIAIQIDNISKLYRLGSIGTGSLKQDLDRWWTVNIQKKPDPFLSELEIANQSINQSFIWALRQVSFDVKKGEIWGIIGANGSGKSTLLKIISRIVRPTSGVVRGNGKLSSMLEIGTGFHHELSGRENIYLSGYILGMSRQEIRQRFDEIIEFSGVGPFIDTPVKRYSSGMYVRLAFAVAAHLSTDILIVDEVLSVGDMEFQKRCLNKMQEFSRAEGRTILFVSHNLQAVGHLCQQALWLQRGSVAAKGPIQSILSQYAAHNQARYLSQAWDSPDSAPGTSWLRLKSVKIVPQLDNVADMDGPIDVRTALTVQFQFWVLQDDLRLLTAMQLFSYGGECVFDVMSSFTECRKGLVEGSCEIPGYFLNDGSYSISLVIYRNTWDEYYMQEECLTFDVEDHREATMNFSGKWWGAVRPQFPVQLAQVEETSQ